MLVGNDGVVIGYGLGTATVSGFCNTAACGDKRGKVTVTVVERTEVDIDAGSTPEVDAGNSEPKSRVCLWAASACRPPKRPSCAVQTCSLRLH